MKTMHEIQRETILERLNHFKGNRTHTAISLKMSLRTLRHKLGRYEVAGYLVPKPYRSEIVVERTV